MNVEIVLKETTKIRPKKRNVYKGMTKCEIHTGYRGSKWLYLSDMVAFVDMYPMDEIESINIFDLS